MKFYRVKALMLKYWYITIVSIDRVMDIFYWPVLSLLIWGFTTNYVRKLAQTNVVLSVFLGGMILWSIFERAQQDVTIFVLEDFWNGNIASIFVTPLKDIELFLSTMILGLARSAISFGAMVLIAYFAYSFNIVSIGAIYLILFLLPLLLFGWALGILIVGLIFRFGLKISIFAWSFAFLLQPVGAVFYPLEILPVWLQKIAFYTPLMHIFEGFRAAFTNTISTNHLFWAFFFSIVYLALGFISFKHFLAGSRKTGFLAKH